MSARGTDPVAGRGRVRHVREAGSLARWLAHDLLRPLSHSRNRRTAEDIRSASRSAGYRPEKARRVFDIFSPHVDWTDRVILDVGCGNGDLCIGLAKAGARRVVGVDLDPVRIDCARRNAAAEGVEDSVRFERLDFAREFEPREDFDLAFSIGTFEHILDPLACLRKILLSLKPGCALGVRFGPLWLSPFGAHTGEFTRVPWVHALFPEKVVLDVRREMYRPDQDVERYEDIDGHLNRMTFRRFRRLVSDAGFIAERLRLNPEKDRKWKGILKRANSLLAMIPGVRELCAVSLMGVLRRPGAADLPGGSPGIYLSSSSSSSSLGLSRASGRPPAPSGMTCRAAQTSPRDGAE